MTKKLRCWNTENPLYIKYHDEEWGVPVHNDRRFFEFLLLGGFQAGLTWELILKRREAFRKAFSNFDPAIVANYSETEITHILNNPLVIRNLESFRLLIDILIIILNIEKEHPEKDNSILSKIKDEISLKLIGFLKEQSIEFLRYSLDLLKYSGKETVHLIFIFYQHSYRRHRLWMIYGQ